MTAYMWAVAVAGGVVLYVAGGYVSLRLSLQVAAEDFAKLRYDGSQQRRQELLQQRRHELIREHLGFSALWPAILVVLAVVGLCWLVCQPPRYLGRWVRCHPYQRLKSHLLNLVPLTAEQLPDLRHVWLDESEAE